MPLDSTPFLEALERALRELAEGRYTAARAGFLAARSLPQEAPPVLLAEGLEHVAGALVELTQGQGPAALGELDQAEALLVQSLVQPTDGGPGPVDVQELLGELEPLRSAATELPPGEPWEGSAPRIRLTRAAAAGTGAGVAHEGRMCTCPYCGESVEVVVDALGPAEERYVEDCFVCCRPWTVSVTRSGGEVDVSLAHEDS